MALTISAVAEHKKIPLTKTEIDINLRVDQGRPTVSAFEVEIDLGPGLSKREQQILFNVARSCDVHKILAGETSFEYHMIDRETSEEAA